MCETACSGPALTKQCATDPTFIIVVWAERNELAVDSKGAGSGVGKREWADAVPARWQESMKTFGWFTCF